MVVSIRIALKSGPLYILSVVWNIKNRNNNGMQRDANALRCFGIGQQMCCVSVR